MNNYEMLQTLKNRQGPLCDRVYAELAFADAYNTSYGSGFEEAIHQQLEKAVLCQHPTAEDVVAIEAALAPLGKKIKSMTVLAVSHAHLDMNWMWSFDETVSITLSTFRTILNFMKEFPDFTFSQSQASTYRIVEKYDPDMLDEIRQYVKEGRWEPTVSSWVETDKNMPAGETLCRHILYAKRYMNELFGIDPDDLKLDFEPDTFGHNANVPQILNAGGVQYYYHCRGYQGHHIYRWQSGDSEVLAYREPVWYNADITPNDFVYMPEFAKKNGISTLLKVYGVGDHGGGPTRRDLTRLLDMMTWPLLPTIRFGTYKEFFATLEEKRDTFPVVSGELNVFATGCYTTQTRIKRFNKLCEKQLYEAEVFDAMRRMQGISYAEGATFKEGWEHILFNDFHDILPGSGVIGTREHALGKYQECLGITTAKKSRALAALAAKIDTSAYGITADADSTSAGAGVGFCHTSGVFAYADRNNNGKNRIYHLFNSTAFPCSTPSIVTVWDYPGNLGDVDVTVNGEKVSYQLLDNRPMFYWTHEYQRMVVDATVPAFGYTTVVIRPKTTGSIPYPFPDYPRLDPDDGFVLENDLLRVELDTMDCSILRMTDKRTGKDILNGKSAYFRLITEDASKEMTAWIVGRYAGVENLTDGVIVRPYEYIKGELVQNVTYTVPFHHSSLRVTISLEKNAPMVTFRCSCDFGEKPVPHQTVPQLGIYIPCDIPDGKYIGDIPFGFVERTVREMDMPSLNGVMTDTGHGNLFVISNSKYGFRTTKDGIAITLIRGSYEPDPLPDFGVSEFDFAIGTADNTTEFDRCITLYGHPCSEVPMQNGNGVLPETGSFLNVTGANLTALKLAEDGNGYILRLSGCQNGATVTLPFSIASAALCDINEKVICPIHYEGDHITLEKTSGVVTVRIEKE